MSFESCSFGDSPVFGRAGLEGSSLSGRAGRVFAGKLRKRMEADCETLTLEQLLDQIEEKNREEDRIELRGVIQAVGDRSFGPLLLVPGLIAFSPISGIPGVATLVGVMLFLISVQLLAGKKHFWLPAFVLDRSVSRKRFDQAMRILHWIGRKIDRLLRPRLDFFVNGTARWVIALFCMLIAFGAPFMEVLPFVISSLGAVVSMIGFGLLARDGLLVLLAGILFGGVVAVGVNLAI